MASPPAETRQIIKSDDAAFYVSRVSNELIAVEALAQQLEFACQRALAIGAQLREAAAAGVGQAADIVAVLDSVTAFSDEASAAAFLATLRAARPPG